MIGPWLAIALICALAYWAIVARDTTSWGRSAVKTGATAALLVAGAQAAAPGLVLTGLALGVLGDFALSRPGQAAFLTGMAAFAAGHAAYVTHFWPLADPLPWPLWAALAVLFTTVAIWLDSRTGALRWPVRLYIAVIFGLCTLFGLPRSHAPAPLGAALFILSDLLLAIQLFATPRPAVARAAWPAYWLGQALILWGSLT